MAAYIPRVPFGPTPRRCCVALPPLPLPLFLLLLRPLATNCDVEIYRSGGPPWLISTVIEDSCAGRDSLLYPHCLCVDNPQFSALDVNGSGYVDRGELSANLPADSNHASIFWAMDADSDGQISVLEYSRSADAYLNASALIIPSIVPYTNATCSACAPGWGCVRCMDPVQPVELKIAVQASETYFHALKQESLRRSLATQAFQWNQARVRFLSVATTTDQGQVVHVQLLHGHERGRGSPMDAALFLASQGSTFYEENLWESLWYVHILCAHNCSLHIAGGSNEWRSGVDADCTSASGNRVFALDQSSCEQNPTGRMWIPQTPSVCKTTAGAIVATGGNSTDCLTPPSNNTWTQAVCMQNNSEAFAPANIPTPNQSACLAAGYQFRQGGSWEFCLTSTGNKAAGWQDGSGQAGILACETVNTSYTFQTSVAAHCSAYECRNAVGVLVEADSESTCEASAGNTWQAVLDPQFTDSSSCELHPSGNTWKPAIAAACLTKSGSFVPGVTSREQCEKRFMTGVCDGKTGQCQCAIGYTGHDCAVAVATTAVVPPPAIKFWHTAAILAAVTVATPCFCRFCNKEFSFCLDSRLIIARFSCRCNYDCVMAKMHATTSPSETGRIRRRR